MGMGYFGQLFQLIPPPPGNKLARRFHLGHVIDRLKNQFWGLLIAFAFHLSGNATREKEFKIRPEFLAKAN